MQNPRLTANGVSQLNQLAHELNERYGAESVTVVDTGLVRTRDTAGVVTSKLNVLKKVCLPALEERKIGLLEGMSFGGLLEKYPDMGELHRTYGSSCVWFLEDEVAKLEPIVHMYQRIGVGLSQLAGYHKANTVLVCHSGTLKMINAFVNGCPPRREDLFEYLTQPVAKNCQVVNFSDI